MLRIYNIVVTHYIDFISLYTLCVSIYKYIKWRKSIKGADLGQTYMLTDHALLAWTFIM